MAARSDVTGGGQKNAGMLRTVGIIVLALVAVGVGALRMGFIHLPGSTNEDSVLAGAPEPAPVATAKVTPPAGAPKDLDLDAPAVEPPGAGATRRPGTRAASTSGSRSPAVTAVTPDAPRASPQLARLDEHVTYQYNQTGRRDPFSSLITGEYVGKDEGGDAPLETGGMRIVGIVWGATDQFAMVEDVKGNSFVLRKGDKVQNGYVEALRRDAVVLNVTADGQSQSVVIPFVRKGEGNAR